MMNEDNAKTELRTRRMPFRPAPNNDPGQSVNVLPIGTHLGEFEILDLIGEGGFGIVYLAYDHSLERHVALKEYMPSSLATRTHGMAVTVRSRHNADTFTAGLKSFVNEAKMLAQFDSPALVKVHRFWEGNGTAYMVMPFYEGITLKQALKERRITPTESWIRVLLADLFDAIETIHHTHCLHRDIAPDNILLLKDGRPLLLDFGAARRVIGDLTQCLTVILKPGFAPIEQYADIAGLRQGAWTDIYALAAVVYYLITGKAPPPAVARMVHDELVPARKAGKGRYSDAFLAVLDKALSVKPEQRFRSIDELRRALDIMETVPRTIPGATANWATTMVRTTYMAEPKPEPKPAVKRETPPDIKQPAKQNPKPAARAEPYLGTAQHVTPEARPAARQEIRPERKPPPQPAAAADNIRRYPAPAEPTSGGRYVRGKRQWMMLGLLLSVGIATGIYLGTNRPWEESSVPGKNTAMESSGSSGTEGQSMHDQAAETAPAASAPSAVPQSGTPSPEASATPALPEPEQEQHAAATARQLSEIEMWRSVSTSDEVSGYQRYLREYPNGRYAPLARIRLERKQPSTAMIAPSDSAPPPSKDAAKPTPVPSDAVPSQMPEPKSTASKKEERLWSTATAINDPTVYEAYLHKYPKGRYAPLAKDRLASFKSRQTDASTEDRSTEGTSAQTDTGTSDTAAAKPDSSASASGSNTDKQASIEPPTATTRELTTPPAEPLPKPAPEASTESGKKTIRVGDQVMTGNFSVNPRTGIVSGTGKIVWANGDQFDGTMVNGQREGKGKFTWHNGQRYSGDWRHDAPNGKGSIVFTDGSRYEGDVRNGVPHGQGVTRFKDGDEYRGAWRDGKSNGQGRYTWTNGSYWEGEFRDDKPTQNGKMVFGGDPARTIVGALPPPTNKGQKAVRAEAGAAPY